MDRGLRRLLGSRAQRSTRGYTQDRYRRFGTRSAAHQRTVAILERPGGFVRRNRGAQLVEVTGILRVRRRLHLEQIGRVYFASIDADDALAKQRIVSRQLFHLRHYSLAVG